MKLSHLNSVLSSSTRHATQYDALKNKRGRENEHSFFHFLIKPLGIQDLQEFEDIASITEFTNENYSRYIQILGFYTVSDGVWHLSKACESYENELNVLKADKRKAEKSFTEQLFQRLLILSEVVTDAYAQLPKDRELWRLCISGSNQEIYIPSESTDGFLTLLPGEVLADFSAQKGLPSMIKHLIQGEDEIDTEMRTANEGLISLLSSKLANILETIYSSEGGIGHTYHNN